MAKNWDATCETFNANINSKKTWNILRHLIDTTTTKTAQSQSIAHLIHNFEGTEQDLLNYITKKYVQQSPPIEHPSYRGYSNNELDAPITEAEVRVAIQRLNTRSAPGPAFITNKMLRNLDDLSVEDVTRLLNECWESGSLPERWRTTKTVLIPKPGKRPHVDHLHPISLTSCLGKLFEHVILFRLTSFAERTHLFPPSMFGFRPNLSTQDVMLQLQHHIIDPAFAPVHTTKAILGLDLTRAFNTVSHSAILTGITNSHLGERTYNYICSFLSDRTFTLHLGPIKTPPINLGSSGTLQGSVLSPFLFNIAMKDLPPLLSTLPDLHHSLYADDITLWISKGADGHIQDTLQTATQIIEAYTSIRELSYSPQKSELFLFRPNRHDTPNISITTRSGNIIPSVDTIRVLGLRLDSKGNNLNTIRELDCGVYQTTRLIYRIASKHGGVKEGNLIRLIQAFVLFRIAYSTPFLTMKLSEQIKIDGMIRKCFRAALKLPSKTSNDCLLALGVHNSLAEIVEAQRTAQLERLTKSHTGRHLLTSLGISSPTSNYKQLVDIPPSIRQTLRIKPLPRPMHPIHNEDRRLARAKFLEKAYPQGSPTLYTDAATYPTKAAAVATVVDSSQAPLASVSLLTTSSTAEEKSLLR